MATEQPTSPGLASGRNDHPSVRGDLARVGGVSVDAVSEHDLREADLAELHERVVGSGTLTWQVHNDAATRHQFVKGLR